MNLFNSPEFKVGLFVLIISGIIAVMSIKVSNDPSGLGSSRTTWFYIEDASGIVKNSAVRMAGIPVGVIRDIRLENGLARVEVILKGDVPLTKSARVEIRPNGILGDKFVEVISGDPRDPPLRSGEQILIVDDRASVDRLIGEVSKITKSVGQVAENVRMATEGDVDKPLGRIIANIEKITSDLAELSSGKKDDVGRIITNLRQTTDTINGLINDDSPDGFKKAWRDALKSLKRIDGTLKNVEEITGKINRGEGTIGKLVNDDKTVEELNTAISGINNFIDAGQKLSTAFDYNSYVFSRDGLAKSNLSVRLQPGLDRYYELGLVDDPDGVLEKTTTKTDTNGTTSTVKEEKRFDNRIKFNALFAKNFWNLTVKGGLIESSGGFGIDYHLFRKRARLSVEAFDLDSINLRATARVNLWGGFYLIGGGDHLASKASRQSAFVGAGLFLTNDDLKLLLTKLPF